MAESIIDGRGEKDRLSFGSAIRERIDVDSARWVAGQRSRITWGRGLISMTGGKGSPPGHLALLPLTL